MIALTATLWQNAHPGPTLARLYERDPALAHAQFEFTPRLTALLSGLIVGLQQTTGDT